MKPFKALVKVNPVLALVFLCVVPWFGCSRSTPVADAIYLNATIQTMDANSSTAQAIAIKGDTILAVGSNQAVLAYKGELTTVADLQNKATILPGFIDSHSHMLGFGVYTDPSWLDVSSVNVLFKPPPGDPRCKNPADFQQCFIPVQTQDDVVRRLKEAVAKSVNPDSLIRAENYDPSRLGHSKGCHPLGQAFECPNFEDGHARQYLDAISTTHPILVTSESGHIVYVNSLELAALDICGTDKADSKCQKPTVNPEQEMKLANLGQLDEDLALWAVSKVASKDSESIIKLAKTAAQAYAAHGFTLVQEGASSGAEADIYNLLTRDPDFPVGATLLIYEDNDVLKEVKTAKAARKTASDNPNLFIAGIKVFADGSTQGYTSFLQQPYEKVFPPFNQKWIFPQQPYKGLPDSDEDRLIFAFSEFHKAGFPIAVHQNGDAAINNVLRAVKTAGTMPHVHDLMIHFSSPSAGDMATARELDAGVTFLMEDLYYYGLPLCQQVVGPELVKTLYPAADALKTGLRIGLHSDTPVTPPYPLFAIWVAKTRLTQRPAWYKDRDPLKCPVTMGPNEAITIKQGIHAYTTDAAWMYGLDDKRGSLEPHKVADMVILSADPLSMENNPEQLKTIRTLATVRRGKYFPNPNAADTPIWPD